MSKLIHPAASFFLSSPLILSTCYRKKDGRVRWASDDVWLSYFTVLRRETVVNSLVKFWRTLHPGRIGDPIDTLTAGDASSYTWRWGHPCRIYCMRHNFTTPLTNIFASDIWGKKTNFTYELNAIKINEVKKIFKPPVLYSATEELGDCIDTFFNGESRCNEGWLCCLMLSVAADEIALEELFFCIFCKLCA